MAVLKNFLINQNSFIPKYSPNSRGGGASEPNSEKIKMLPKRLPLAYIDEGVRKLVVNLNRIPDVFTNTTCEGHIWRNTPAWPTKDGWIHLNIEEGTNTNLVSTIESEFLESHPIFEIEKWGSGLFKNFNHYTLVGHYESHEDGELFHRINEEEQQKYFERAEITRVEMLKGWDDLNKVVVNYLTRNYGPNFRRSLPFRELRPNRNS